MTAGGSDGDFAVLLAAFTRLSRRLDGAVLGTDDDAAMRRAGELLDALSGMSGHARHLRARIVARMWNASRMSYADLGVKLGLSRQRVNQLMQAAREAPPELS